MMELKKKKKKTNKKLNKIFMAFIISAGLMTSCGEFKGNEIENIKVDEDKSKTEEVNDNDSKKENGDLEQEIDEDLNEKNDEDIEENDKLKEIKEEFEKECFNHFKIAEILLKMCIEDEKKFTNNGVECTVESYECRVKKIYDKLVETIKTYPTKEDWINNDLIQLNKLINNFFITTMYSDGELHKIIDLPDPVLSNNDFIEGYVTEFEIKGIKFYIKDQYNPNRITIKDEKGIERDFVERFLNFEDISFSLIILEEGKCIFPDYEKNERDILLFGKGDFIYGSEGHDYLYYRNCEEDYKKYLDEFIKRILENE